jgi:predicted amidophosphoribosyltransferase
LPAVVTASMPPQPPASTAEKICPKCQAANTAAAHHCRNCGASLA